MPEPTDQREMTKELLQSLRWAADMVITNYNGERVWLKEAYQGEKRIGITDCCLESYPCDWHKAIAQKNGSLSK